VILAAVNSRKYSGEKGIRFQKIFTALIKESEKRCLCQASIIIHKFFNKLVALTYSSLKLIMAGG